MARNKSYTNVNSIRWSICLCHSWKKACNTWRKCIVSKMMERQGRTIYIIVFKIKCKIVYIIDPTFWYELNDSEQAKKIKKKILFSSIKFFKDNFQNKYAVKKYFIKGSWFGASGAVPEKIYTFLNKLQHDFLKVCNIDSLGMWSNYIYRQFLFPWMIVSCYFTPMLFFQFFFFTIIFT